MSFGLVKASEIKSKAALKRAVAEFGADKIMVFDTAMAPHNRGIIPLTELKSADVIVMPDVYRDRRFYANFRNGKVV